MDHIFVSVLSSSPDVKEARLTEISTIRATGFGPYRKQLIQKAFTSSIREDNFADIAKAMQRSMNVESDRYVVVTYQSEFVRKLLDIECANSKISPLFQGRLWIDIGQLAWPLLASQIINSRSLETLAAHFGIEFRTTYNDDSCDKCTAYLQIYGQIMRRYKTALLGEQTMRDLGGETLEQIRNMVGF